MEARNGNRPRRFLLLLVVYFTKLSTTYSLSRALLQARMSGPPSFQQETRVPSSSDVCHALPFVEASVAGILQLEAHEDADPRHLSSSHQELAIDPQTFCVVQTVIPPSLNINERCVAHDLHIRDLIPLANECDRLLFETHDSTPVANVSRIERMRQDPLIRLVRLEQEKYVSSGKETHSVPPNDSFIDSWVLTCTLLALNALETAIRKATGFTTAKAPLLTTMLQKIPHQDDILVPVLELVLLPTGLNLRNLLWHGFVAEHLPRAWLALVLVLQHQVQHMCGNNQEPENSFVLEKSAVLRHVGGSHPRLARAVQQGRTIRHTLKRDGSESSTFQIIADWLPTSHRSLWRHCVDNLLSHTDETLDCPWITTSHLLLLLEHGLRLDWCRLHDSHKDSQARHGQFYVTLDGHGQRHKHNLLLHPFMYESLLHSSPSNDTREACRENLLIRRIGASTVALLTDLLVSPAGGPNVRACLSHGLLDCYLENELQSLLSRKVECSVSKTCAATDIRMEKDVSGAWDIMDILLLALARVAAAPNESSSGSKDALQYYRPVFSYTAVTLQRLRGIQKQLLVRFPEMIQANSDLIESWQVHSALAPPQSLSQLAVATDDLNDQLNTLLYSLGTSSETWTVLDLLAEHETNQGLASLGATRLLLWELDQAVESFLDRLKPALQLLHDTTKDRRRSERVVACARPAMQIFMFCAAVSFLSLRRGLDKTIGNDANDLKKAVQRTRMVLSTVDTFLLKNAERAFQAIDSYARGKAVKDVARMIHSRSAQGY